VRAFLIWLVVLMLVLPLAGAATLLWQNRLPWQDPPGPWLRLGTYLGANVARLDPDSPFPELRPRAWPQPPRLVAEALRATVSARGWRLVVEDARSGRFQIVVTSRLLGLEDVLNLEVGLTTDGGSVLTGIARRRAWPVDFGSNSRHLMDVMAGIEQRLSGL
jgi:hypothetical protein